MSGFRHNFIKGKVDADVLFTDTDSLTQGIKSQDADLTLVNINQNFQIHQAQKLLGKMKVEFKEIPINKFIGLKSKMFLKKAKKLTQEGE